MKLKKIFLKKDKKELVNNIELKKKKKVTIEKDFLKLKLLEKLEEEGHIKGEVNYIKVLEVEGQDMYSLKNSEIENKIFQFHSFLKIMTLDIKIIILRYPVNTEIQKDYVLRKIKNSTSKIQKKFLDIKFKELLFLEKNRTNKEFYMFIFAKTKDELEESERTCKNIMGQSFKLNDVNSKKMILICKKLLNQNEKIS